MQYFLPDVAAFGAGCIPMASPQSCIRNGRLAAAVKSVYRYTPSDPCARFVAVTDHETLRKNKNKSITNCIRLNWSP